MKKLRVECPYQDKIKHSSAPPPKVYVQLRFLRKNTPNSPPYIINYNFVNTEAAGLVTQSQIVQQKE